MARGRTDSGSSNVENYRKQIAKQDAKKSKENLKETKFQADKKENAPSQYKDVSIMVGALLVIAMFIYGLFYIILSESAVRML